MKTIFYTLLAIAALVVILIILFNHIKGASAKYKKKELLTDNEREFFLRLQRALAGYVICPQVSMGAILQPNVSRKDNKRYFQILGTFSQKIIDYVICDPKTLQVLAIVELDDRSHSIEKDKKRDQMLESAGYKLMRWQSKKKPTEEEIRTEFIQLLKTGSSRNAPVVEKAGSPVLPATKPLPLKLATSKLSNRLGIKTYDLLAYGVAAGFLERVESADSEDEQYVLTDAGKDFGLEYISNSMVPYFLWPADFSVSPTLRTPPRKNPTSISSI